MHKLVRFEAEAACVFACVHKPITFSGMFRPPANAAAPATGCKLQVASCALHGCKLQGCTVANSTAAGCKVAGKLAGCRASCRLQGCKPQGKAASPNAAGCKAHHITHHHFATQSPSSLCNEPREYVELRGSGECRSVSHPSEGVGSGGWEEVAPPPTPSAELRLSVPTHRGSADLLHPLAQ